MIKAFYLAAAALVCTIVMAPAAATARDENLQEAQDFNDPQVRVCPDGTYKGRCDRDDIFDAVTISDDISTDYGKYCIFQTKARCTPTVYGFIPASKFSGLIVWQHMNIYPEGAPHVEMLAMAERLSKNLTNVIAAPQTEGWYGVPDVIENSDRLLMIHAPGRTGGTGAGNIDIVLTRHQMGWITFDVNEYLEQASNMLPEGFELAGGVNFNFREMHASVPVKRPDDGSCCATDGIAHIDFGLPRPNWMQVDLVTFEEMAPVKTHQIKATENLMEYDEESIEGE